MVVIGVAIFFFVTDQRARSYCESNCVVVTNNGLDDKGRLTTNFSNSYNIQGILVLATRKLILIIDNTTTKWSRQRCQLAMMIKMAIVIAEHVFLCTCVIGF